MKKTVPMVTRGTSLVCSLVSGIFFSCFFAIAAFGGLYNPKTFTLANGLQVIVLENHRAPVVSQIVWYKVGTAEDPWGKTGLAHYVEHMMFNGAEGEASREYQKALSERGGIHNASTGQDTTHYYAIVAPEHLEKIAALEAGRMARLTVLDEQAATERKVVLEERNMRMENNPIARFAEILNARFFSNHPYRLPSIGWEHEIRGLTPKDVQDFHAKWYAPNNAVLIYAGDITEQKARELAEKYYAVIPAKKLEGRNRLQEPPRRETTERISMETVDVHEPFFFRLYDGPNFRSDNGKHAFSIQILEYILEVDPWGFFYERLVKARELANFVQISHTSYSFDPMPFCLIMQPRVGRSLSELEKAFEEAVTELLEKGIPAESVERAKRQMIANTIFASDSVLGGADEIGHRMALGIPVQEVDNWVERIKAVTPAEVNATARLVFANRHHLTGYLVPAQKVDGKKGEQKS